MDMDMYMYMYMYNKITKGLYYTICKLTSSSNQIC